MDCLHHIVIPKSICMCTHRHTHITAHDKVIQVTFTHMQ